MLPSKAELKDGNCCIWPFWYPVCSAGLLQCIMRAVLYSEISSYIIRKIVSVPKSFLTWNYLQIPELDSSSYFERNPEFTAWLKDDRQIFFNDLSSTEARKLFEEFIKLWNSRELLARYYHGISPAEARRSQHTWGIKGKPRQNANQSKFSEKHHTHLGVANSAKCIWNSRIWDTSMYPGLMAAKSHAASRSSCPLNISKQLISNKHWLDRSLKDDAIAMYFAGPLSRPASLSALSCIFKPFFTCRRLIAAEQITLHY